MNVAAVVEALHGTHRSACWIYTYCLEAETLVWDWATVAQDLDWAATAVAGGALEQVGKILQPLLQRLPSFQASPPTPGTSRLQTPLDIRRQESSAPNNF